MVEVIRGRLALKCQLMERFERIESENRLRALESCGDPTGTKCLCAVVEDCATLSAVTEIDANTVYTAGVEDHEISWPWRR
jgi:hypothetical protein